MATDRLAIVGKFGPVYPSFNPSLAASMTADLDALYDSALWSTGGSLRQLFTSSQATIDAPLAGLYGLSYSGPWPQPVALDPKIRTGVLARAGYLTAHSDDDSSGPIARGVFVLQSILCAPPAPPPQGVPAAPAATDPSVQTLTTRQRFAAHVSSPACASCHTRIDGIGFGFEEFDGIGVYRTTEHGRPVDSSGTLIGTGDADGDFVGVAGLTAKLVDSSSPVDCYTRQAYRYAMGQVEPPRDDLQSLRAGFSIDGRLTDVLLALVRSPVFVTRNFESTGP
jgi:hypothetical protein